MESSGELGAYNSERLGGEISFRTILEASSKRRSLRSLGRGSKAYGILKYHRASTSRSDYRITASLLICGMARVLYFCKSIKLRSTLNYPYILRNNYRLNS